MGQILGIFLSVIVKWVLWKRVGEGKEEGICGENDVSRDLVDTHGAECQHWVGWSENSAI